LDPCRLCVCLASVSSPLIGSLGGTVVDDAVHVEVEIVESGITSAHCLGVLLSKRYSGMLLSAMSWLHMGHRSEIHRKNCIQHASTQEETPLGHPCLATAACADSFLSYCICCFCWGTAASLKVESQLCRKADTSSLDLHTTLVTIEISPPRDATVQMKPKKGTKMDSSTSRFSDVLHH
jgi:hypothetical protein